MTRQNPGKAWLSVVAAVIISAFLMGCQEKARTPATASTRPDQPEAAEPVASPADTAPAAKPAVPDEPPARRNQARTSAVKPPPAQPTGSHTPARVTELPGQPTKTQAIPATTAPSKPIEPEPSKPKRPITVSWVRFRKALEPKEDVTCEAAWTGGNRLEIHTTNIKRLTLDLTKLPEGAPRKGPWIIQIDGQGIELTGFRPKEGYSGKIRDLVCSKNGRWSVDRKALYRGPR